MTSRRILLLTLLQIHLISSLPHHPHEREHDSSRKHGKHGKQREHGIQREHHFVESHGSNAVFRPHALAFDPLDISSDVNSVFEPVTSLGATISAPVATTTPEIFSTEPLFTTSLASETTVSEVPTFTSTTSFSTESEGFSVFPTRNPGSVAPLPIPISTTSSFFSTSSSYAESTSVFESSSEASVFTSSSSIVEEPTVSTSSTFEASETYTPTSAIVETSSTFAPTSMIETSSAIISIATTKIPHLVIPTSSAETSLASIPTSTFEEPPPNPTTSTVKDPSAFTPSVPVMPPLVNTTVGTTSTILSSPSSSRVQASSVSSNFPPVYSTSDVIPPWYSMNLSTTSCSTTSTRSSSSFTVPTSTFTDTTVTTKTRRTRTRITKTTKVTVEPTFTQSESSPSTSLIIPSQTLSTTSTIIISQTRTRTTFPALQPSNSVPVLPPALSFTATHTLVPSSTISLTLATTLTVSEVQTLTSTTTVPPTTGTVQTHLNTQGQNTLPPFNTTVLPPPTRTVRPITKGPNQITFSRTMIPTASVADNIFVPVARGAPPKQIPSQGGHPLQPIGVNQKKPIQTNKFYANFFLGNRNQSTWTHPYSLAWVMGGGATGSWGLSVAYQPRSKIVYGPGSPPSYYINALGIQAIILSARELGGSTDLSVDQLEGFSCNVNLSPSTGATPVITFPLVQGMGFVTAIYNGGTPFIQSGVFFNKLTYGGTVGADTARYLVTLTDGSNWFIYVIAEKGSALPTLTLSSSGEIVGSRSFVGTVQVARIPDSTNSESVRAIYDAAAGVYPIAGDVQASTSGPQGEYQLSWTKAGKTTKSLLMFALPHHVQSFSPSFKKSALKRALQLDTTTKGRAVAVSADAWSLFHDDIPYDMGFAPWSPQMGSRDNLPASALPLLKQVASYELAENFTAQTYLNSMYFSGKGLAKFAFTVYTANDLAKDRGIAAAGLVKLKDSFAAFVNNRQIFPLVYDTVWGGVVSSCTYTTGDPNCDFGNSNYNDHHFHYGYFVYTAAVIGYLDPAWLKEGSNKYWVNTLVRDYANPVSDATFPFQRMFDWYHGHSWAHGLYETADGKDQESSSEDAFASYAIKMWGRTVGDPNMEARGNLMLAVQGRSFENYYLMKSNNKVEPPSFVPNKASGIIFENKIDHTTYFGTNVEYIEGIHMIPLNPSSTLTRDRAFVAQEWNQYFANGYADTIQSGWRGIVYANLAIVDPVTAYNFFAQDTFDMAWLDGGASRTWYLAWSAGLGGTS